LTLKIWINSVLKELQSQLDIKRLINTEYQKLQGGAKLSEIAKKKLNKNVR